MRLAESSVDLSSGDKWRGADGREYEYLKQGPFVFGGILYSGHTVVMTFPKFMRERPSRGWRKHVRGTKAQQRRVTSEWWPVS